MNKALKSPFVIRDAELSDIDELVRLFRRNHEATALSRLEFVDEKVKSELVKHLNNKSAACAFVAVRDDRIVGIFSGYISEFAFSYEKLAKNAVVYVVPEERTSFIAIRLIKRFHQWVEDVGVRELHFSMTSGLNVERTTSLFEELGYERVGAILKKNIASIRK